MCSIYHKHFDIGESMTCCCCCCCVSFGLMFQCTSVMFWSRVLLLWSFKAKRENGGVQRQLDMTSTQGQTLVFIFIVIFFFCLDCSNDHTMLQVWGRVPTYTQDNKAVTSVRKGVTEKTLRIKISPKIWNVFFSFKLCTKLLHVCSKGFLLSLDYHDSLNFISLLHTLSWVCESTGNPGNNLLKVDYREHNDKKEEIYKKNPNQ